MRTALLVVGSLLPMISAIIYIRSIFQGKSVPHRTTRLLLLVITAIMTVTLWAEGDTSGLWLALASFVESLIIWVLSFKRGIGGRDRLDILCLVLCVAGIGLWLWSGESLLGLLASLVADLIACIPSIHKTIRWPHTESLSFYALAVLAGVLIFLAGPYDWRTAIFPIYIAAVNLLYVVIIIRGQRRAGIPPTAVG